MSDAPENPLEPSNPYERHAQMQPRLTESMIEHVLRFARVRPVERGEILFEVGSQQTDFILVLSGALAIESDGCDGTETIVEHRRGAFSGEIDMFSNRRAIVRGRCIEPGEMGFLDRERFRRMLASHADLSEVIMRAFILRRTGLIQTERGDTTLVGDPSSAETLSLRSFLARNGHPHRLLDPVAEPGVAETLQREYGLNGSDLPAIVWRRHDVLRRPTVRQVADLIGLSQPGRPNALYDVAVIGVGPGGLAAAVNASAEGLSVIAIESTAPGGQAGTSSKIENYPAFPTGISGQALGARMMLQSQKFGTEIITPREVQAIGCEVRPYVLRLEDGQELRAHAVVIATGARWRRLGLEGEERLENAGVYYGATAVEARMCAAEEVAVIGGGNSAGQAAIFLSGHAKHVHILVRSDTLSTSMSDYLIRRIEQSPNITLHKRTEVFALEGEAHLTGMRWRNSASGEERPNAIRHVFVMIGASPNTRWLEGCVMLDDRGFVVTGSDVPIENLVSETWDVRRMPHPSETSRPAIFAVGDVRSGSVKRVASAVGEGAMAAQALYRVVEEEKARLATRSEAPSR